MDLTAEQEERWKAIFRRVGAYGISVGGVDALCKRMRAYASTGDGPELRASLDRWAGELIKEETPDLGTAIEDLKREFGAAIRGVLRYGVGFR